MIQGLRQFTEKPDFSLLLVFNSLTCLCQQVKGKKPPVASSGVTGKGKTLSSQQKKVDSTAGVKRTSSSKFIIQFLGAVCRVGAVRAIFPPHLLRWRCQAWGSAGERGLYSLSPSLLAGLKNGDSF